MANPVQENLYAPRSNPLYRVAAVVIITIVGTALGYYILGQAEGHPWSFFDCVYMTVISLTTVGYGETLPDFADVPLAREYTIVILLVGYGCLLWAFSTIIAVIVEGRFSEILGRRRMMRDIAELTGHYLVCGLGETGRHAVEEMQRTRRQVVVIDKDRDRLSWAAEKGLLFVDADAEDEAVLVNAGIRQAAGLIACLAEDKDNIYLVLSARQLNPELRIVARGVAAESSNKLVRAGADVVVSPNFIGGLRMASEMIRPHVTTFLDVMLRDKTHVIRVDEVTISPNSDFAGKTLGDADIYRRTGLLIIATQAEQQDEFTYNPGPGQALEVGMTLVVLGSVEDIAKLRKIAQS